MRLENRLGRLEERKTRSLTDIEHAHREIAHARDGIGQSFPQAAQLAGARARARHINEQLEQMAAPQQPAEQAAPNAATTPPPGRPEPDNCPGYPQSPGPAQRPHASSGHAPWRQDRPAPAPGSAWRYPDVSHRPGNHSRSPDLEAGQ